jgi:hypothetical protein
MQQSLIQCDDSNRWSEKGFVHRRLPDWPLGHEAKRVGRNLNSEKGAMQFLHATFLLAAEIQSLMRGRQALSIGVLLKSVAFAASCQEHTSSSGVSSWGRGRVFPYRTSPLGPALATFVQHIFSGLAHSRISVLSNRGWINTFVS